MLEPSLNTDVLLRRLERERQSRLKTEEIFEQTSLELYQAYQSTLHTLNQEHGLLEQYKVAVDETAIVSKADKFGSITYANKAFCTLSEYEEHELIGRSHNILRHPDVPSWVYKELWQTIKTKKRWNGQLKNLSKSGKIYYVDTTIVPILNVDGDIEEYMSIRFDITDVMLLQQEIFDTQKEIVLTLSELGETRAKETGQHVKRVAEYSYRLALLAGLDDMEAEIILSASPMHDIGKIGIPDHILLKPSKLTDDEYSVMKTHAQKGHDVFSKSTRPILKAAAIIAHQHHERWDGMGYPRGLKDLEIHLYGRITAIADVFDALISKRAYKSAWTEQSIVDYFKEHKGKQFDPFLTDLFLVHFVSLLILLSAGQVNLFFHIGVLNV
jgi:PAS domain S-box-containing protein